MADDRFRTHPQGSPGAGEPADFLPVPGGLEIRRLFTREGVHPFDQLAWERRDAVIADEQGRVIFAQKGVEFPKAWSQTASQIVASKYFHGGAGPGSAPDDRRENSLKQLVARVADAISGWGMSQGCFATTASQQAFRDELIHLLVEQKLAFNSPVWFNVGFEPKPQCSACFINSVEDNMDSILELVKIEGTLFKFGSGTGTNFSRLRGSSERLSGGGTALVRSPSCAASTASPG